MTKKEISGKICKDQNCCVCCWETEMLLSASDIQRINEKTGFSVNEYSFVDKLGHRTLKNKEINHRLQCFFLNEQECTIYNSRPKGCQYYPIIWDMNSQEAVTDDYCPHHLKFDDQIPRIEKPLKELILELYGYL
ncbi:MAG: YkgJ family cysteine cluster protein [Candidatus Heimdallarchaeota archaeon]|nr:YkgJ family cysteine cluster protein [Candidatus Heimdallarchaeota archaeon]